MLLLEFVLDTYLLRVRARRAIPVLLEFLLLVGGSGVPRSLANTPICSYDNHDADVRRFFVASREAKRSIDDAAVAVDSKYKETNFKGG